MDSDSFAKKFSKDIFREQEKEAREYVDYRISQGWSLLRIAKLHDVPPKYSNCYTESHLVDVIAKDALQLSWGMIDAELNR